MPIKLKIYEYEFTYRQEMYTNMDLDLNKKTNMNIDVPAESVSTYMIYIYIYYNTCIWCCYLEVAALKYIPRYEYHFDPSGECALVGLMCPASWVFTSPCIHFLFCTRNWFGKSDFLNRFCGVKQFENFKIRIINILKVSRSVVLWYPDPEAWANSNARFSLAEFLLRGALAAGLPEGLRQWETLSGGITSSWFQTVVWFLQWNWLWY